MTLSELLDGIRSDDEVERTEAWNASPSVGAAAIAPLAELSAHSNLELARAAMRGLWAITRDAGHPDAEQERAEVVPALIALTDAAHGEQLRRESVWMLSEVGDDTAVPVLSDLLSDAALRDDARMALERIPGDASLHALRTALEAAGGDFQPNLAHSLRVRGETVPDIPDLRLVPQRPTAVTKAGE